MICANCRAGLCRYCCSLVCTHKHSYATNHTDSDLDGIITLNVRIDHFVSRHGGIRPAARALRVDAGYLSRLRYGTKNNPSASLLHKLGLRKVVVYQIMPQPKIRRTAGA